MWLCFAASVALFFIFARYRYPMTAPMILFAASGLTHIYQQLQGKRIKGLASSVSVALLFAIVVNWPIISKSSMEAPTHFNIGYELERRNELDAARDFYLESVAIVDANTLAHNNLGMLAMKQNRPDEAIAHFSNAVSATTDARSFASQAGVLPARKNFVVCMSTRAMTTTRAT